MQYWDPLYDHEGRFLNYSTFTLCDSHVSQYKFSDQHHHNTKSSHTNVDLIRNHWSKLESNLDRIVDNSDGNEFESNRNQFDSSKIKLKPIFDWKNVNHNFKGFSTTWRILVDLRVFDCVSRLVDYPK